MVGQLRGLFWLLGKVAVRLRDLHASLSVQSTKVWWFVVSAGDFTVSVRGAVVDGAAKTGAAAASRLVEQVGLAPT